jgi:hypothetical protein
MTDLPLMLANLPASPTPAAFNEALRAWLEQQCGRRCDLRGLWFGDRCLMTIQVDRGEAPCGFTVIKWKRDGARLYRRDGVWTTGWDLDLHAEFLAREAAGHHVVIAFVHVADGEVRMAPVGALPIHNTDPQPAGAFATGKHYIDWNKLPLRIGW